MTGTYTLARSCSSEATSNSPRWSQQKKEREKRRERGEEGEGEKGEGGKGRGKRGGVYGRRAEKVEDSHTVVNSK